MIGYRKFTLGLAYLVGVLSLAVLEILRHDKPDLVGLGALASGLAIGVGVIVWGNVQSARVAAEGK